VAIWNKNKTFYFIFYLFPTSALKKLPFFSLFLFHPPLHHLPCKYGAPKQAKHEKINVLRPVPEQNFFPE
jgi:hypothetical protein